MKELKQLEDYYKNNEIDIDKIIEDFTLYITTIINNGTDNAISFEDEEEKEIAETKVEEMIVNMNAKAYYRLTDKERFYKEMSTVDYPTEERVYYQMEDKIRNAWVVVITYVDDWEDVVTRYTRGGFSYFIDATTGEVIGGAIMDYTYSAR